MEDILYFNNELAKKTKYDGYYATKSGKIISIKIKGAQGKLDINNPKELAYKLDKDGYITTCLSMIIEGKKKNKYPRVHKLIWETFNGEIKNDLTIDHIDRNKENNNLNNLRLLTREENTSLANKGKANPNRYFYNLYKNDILLGKYDRKGLNKLLGLMQGDFEKGNTSRVKKLNSKGYYWFKI